METIKNGYTAYFLSAHELIAMIKENIATGKIHRKIRTLSEPRILIIDEVGYAGMDEEVAYYFFRSFQTAMKKTPLFSPPTNPTAAGVKYSVTMSLPQPSWTVCFTTPQPSISKGIAFVSGKRKSWFL